ncbi:MAG: 50S ribosomal protein L23 [Actinomycetota bacterium]|jgi:large subunit ribosomal protein L23
MKDETQIIIRPLLTEKTTFLQRLNKYTFEVAKDATKIEVQKAIESLGRCRVEKVNTLIVKGKVRRTRRGTGRTPDWKKAVVTLKEDEKLGGLLGEAFETM